jgi:hypothetical protein
MRRRRRRRRRRRETRRQLKKMKRNNLTIIKKTKWLRMGKDSILRLSYLMLINGLL